MYREIPQFALLATAQHTTQSVLCNLSDRLPASPHPCQLVKIWQQIFPPICYIALKSLLIPRLSEITNEDPPVEFISRQVNLVPIATHYIATIYSDMIIPSLLSCTKRSSGQNVVFIFPLSCMINDQLSFYSTISLL
jgi:hypothetical protein